MNIENVKTIAVVGWAKSGMALARLGLSLGKKVKVTDGKPQDTFDQKTISDFVAKGVSFEFGAHSESFLKGCDLAVLSPGVDPQSSLAVKILQQLGILFVGEIEFCYWLTKAKIVAITGTNGKTTTTFLTYSVLRKHCKSSVRNVFLGGNIGIPISSFILKTKKNDIIVLEVSSFQLETIIEFKPYVAAITNIEPNHLDRHPDFGHYFDAKMNIFRNQSADDWALLNKNSVLFSQMQKPVKSQLKVFSDEMDNENYSCVYRIAEIFGLSKADCLDVFSRFRGLSFRMQAVRTHQGVTFYNDSKSTTPTSTVWALQRIKKPVVLLAGGKDKGVDYSVIIPYLGKVKKVNLIGQAAPKIAQALNGKVQIQDFGTSFDQAINASFKEAGSGSAVLFSPMCASFDMFDNYIDRGRKFNQIVKRI